ncbi:MAG TPA: hypothetical protein GX391_06110 [Firmicutes bacterium]|nr:hypothetical protein [Bacillota bacterium]HOQ24881.1 hypothetical protein [Bacillota bacterium]HPT68260.1 hypothetical protein [Bacillota bacterium]
MSNGQTGDIAGPATRSCPPDSTRRVGPVHNTAPGDLAIPFTRSPGLSGDDG